MADEDKKVSLILDGKAEGLLSMLAQSQKGVESAVGEMTNHFNLLGSGIDKVTGIIGIMTGVLAGGAAFKHIISDTTNWIGEVGKLSRTLGVSAEKASIMKVAMHGLGIEGDTVTGAVLRIAKSINSDGGAAIEKLGVHVRDSNGNLRNSAEIMFDVNSKLANLTAGTVRNTAGLSVYSKSWRDVQTTLRLTREEFDEFAIRAEKLHMVFSQASVDDMRTYKKQMAEIGMVGESLKIQIGIPLISVLGDLAEMLQGPATKGAQIFAGSVHEIHSAIRDVIKSHRDWKDSLEAGIGSKATDTLTLFLAAKAAATGNYSSIPTILKMGYQASRNIQHNDMDMSDMTMAGVPGGPGGKPAPGGSGGAGGAGGKGLTESQRIALAVGKHQVKEFFKNVDEEVQTQIDSEQWTWNKFSLLSGSGLRGTGGGLNSMLKGQPTKYNLWNKEDQQSAADVAVEASLNKQGKMSVGQQQQFDQTAMTSDWATRKEAQYKAELEKEKEFNAMRSASAGENTQMELLRIQKEADAWEQSWAKNTDSFAVYEERKAQIKMMTSEKIAALERQTHQKSLASAMQYTGATANLFGSLYEVSGKKLKAFFYLQQAANASSAVMSGFKAGAAAVEPPPIGLGPVFGGPLAAIMIAGGFASATSIMMQKPDSVSGGGAGSASYGGGTPTSPVVTQPVSNQSTQPQITIQINNPIGERAWFEKNLPGILKDFSSRNVDVGVQYT